MTFADIVATLSKELKVAIETEDDTCAVRAESTDALPATVLLQGLDEKESLLMTADLGLPPPERLERLYHTLLVANDLFRDTGGATLSIDPATGHVRLQRYDSYDILTEAGPSKALMTFASFASSWAGIINDFRDAPVGAENDTDIHAHGELHGVRV